MIRWWNGDEVEELGPTKGLPGFVEARRLSDGKILTIASRERDAADVARARKEWQEEQAGFRRLRVDNPNR